MRVLLIGPPGAAKGTQASRIAAHFDLARIATGYAAAPPFPHFLAIYFHTHRSVDMISAYGAALLAILDFTIQPTGLVAATGIGWLCRRGVAPAPRPHADVAGRG